MGKDETKEEEEKRGRGEEGKRGAGIQLHLDALNASHVLDADGCDVLPD
jgi:hypothetical protein